MADESTPASPTPETPPPRTTGGNWRWEPPSAEELQKLMPGYTIEKLLGRGGMGAVYRGVQTNLDRPVAIKILPPGVEKEDPSFAERFKSEARLMARLSNPAVVGVYDFGTNLGGQLYFAMEYVDGSDVSQMIAAQGKLPPEHALAITAHVCDALQAAHELGIVHRDIKPANVLLNMKGQVKVADFGLAKVEDPGQHGLTKTGYAMGTPDFVAPEALTLGTAIDGRADLYAVGVMLYQMLTGNIPRGAFKPASVLVPGLDPRFDPIILKAMQHDRAERHQSAAELRRELDVILTVPFVRNDAPASAAIPVAQMAQAPGQRSAAQKPQPQSRPGVATARPAAGGTATDGRAKATPVLPPKSKAPLFIGLGAVAAIAVGAFVMMGGGDKAKQSGPLNRSEAEIASQGLPEGRAERGNPLSGTSVPSASDSAQGTVRTTSSTTPIKVREEPKHAPSVSSTPALPISKSAAPQFPPGQWVKMFTKFEDLPENLRKPASGVKLEDGWICCEVGKPQRIYVVNTLSNYAIRAKIRRQSKEYQGKYLFIRAEPSGGGNAGYALAFSTDFLFAGQKIDGSNLYEHFWKASASEVRRPDIGDEYTLEFGCVGNKLISRLGTEFVKVIADTKRNRGSGYFSGGEPIRDIEVINLDGLPEAEALRLLGVDEKGNDLRGASVAQSSAGLKPAPVPTTPSAPKSAQPAMADATAKASGDGLKPGTTLFPPGQWVKVFTKFEDLPELLRKPDSSVKFEDGWIIVSNATSSPLWLQTDLVQNSAIRAKVRWADENVPLTRFNLRHEKVGSGLSNAVRTALQKAGRFVIDQESAVGGTSKRVTIREGQLTSAPQIGDELMMEFGVFGSRAVARVNGVVLSCTYDAMNKGSIAYIFGQLPIRDIEVMNLDGISEAEALKILGVDEKGNDTRAAALAAEKKAMEQAKAVDAMAAIPELKTLHEQFVKLQAERVTAPFEAEVAKLNAGYVGGIDRKIAEETAAGHLDGVIALEVEKKLIQGQGVGSSRPHADAGGQDGPPPSPIPAEDDDQTTANLKSLRTIYRAAYAKIEAARSANLKALTDPLTLRLKQLETDLTKQKRVPDAKTVREYREGLGQSRPLSPLSGTKDAGSANTPNATAQGTVRTTKKFPPGDDRKAAEWVFSVGGSVRILGSDKMILDAADLPRGRFELTGVYLEFTSTNPPKAPIDNLLPLAGLKGLKRLNVRGIPMTAAHWEILPSLPTLQAFMAERTGVTDDLFAALAATQIKILDLNFETSITGEGFEALGATKSLEKLSMYNFLPSEEGLRQIGKLETLTFLALSGSGSKLRDEHLPLLAGLKRLDTLLVRRTALTAEAVAAMKQWSGVTTLGFDMPPGTTTTQVALLSKAFPKLEVFSLEGEASWNYTAEDVGALAGFPRLKSISMTTNTISDEALAGVLALSKLESLRFSNCAKVTDAALKTFGQHKALTTLSLESMLGITDACLPYLTGLHSLTRLELLRCPTLTDAAIDAFQKARPDVTVVK